MNQYEQFYNYLIERAKGEDWSHSTILIDTVNKYCKQNKCSVDFVDVTGDIMSKAMDSSTSHKHNYIIKYDYISDWCLESNHSNQMDVLQLALRYAKNWALK